MGACCCCCCCCGGNVPRPQDGVQKLSDAGVSSYVELPEDTIFVESCASNDKFQAGTVFVPLQRGSRGQLFIYEFDIRSKQANRLHGPVNLPGEDAGELTPFGCALTNDGRLWICVYNRNLVISMNVRTGEVMDQVEVLAPNDVCVDPKDDSVAYAVGGTESRCCCLPVTDPTRGTVWRIQTRSGGRRATRKRIVKGATTLAGIEKIENTVYASQLYDMFTTKASACCGCLRNRHVVWRGDAADRKTWLADNIQKFDSNTLIIPAYSSIPKSQACFLRCRVISSVGNFFAQLITCAAQGEACNEAFTDPEVSLKLSINDTDDPLKIILLDTTGTAKHFEVDLSEAQQRQSTTERRYFFDANVTNIAHVESKLVCINFQQPRILLLDDRAFREGMGSST